MCQLGNSKPLPSVLDFTVFYFKTSFSETTFDFFSATFALSASSFVVPETVWSDVAVDKCNTESK